MSVSTSPHVLRYVHCLHFRPQKGTWLLISLSTCNCNSGWLTLSTLLSTAELLYCTNIQILCDLPFASFCMIFAKLIVEKKLRHEYSVINSTSSSRFSPLGSTVIFWMVCLGGRFTSSSGRTNWGFLERFRRQYWKKLPNKSMEKVVVLKEEGLTCSMANPPSRRRNC